MRSTLSAKPAVSEIQDRWLVQRGPEWVRRYGRECSAAELTEISRNLVGFFQLLLSWKQSDDGSNDSHCSTPGDAK